MNQNFQESGYLIIRNFFDAGELSEFMHIAEAFHEAWKSDNTEFYQTRAVNSSNITGTQYLDESSRQAMYKFIASAKLMSVVNDMFLEAPAFMATQLFFNPANKNQKNYWHRDGQYHMSLREQQEALKGPDVIHFRIPLRDEPGLELIPGTHKRWDTDEELKVRCETDGHKNSEDLSAGVALSLKAGDLLVFSANMMHRGLYGNDRLALDLIFCDPEPSLLLFVNQDGLPNEAQLKGLDDPSAFIKTCVLTSTIRDTKL